MSSSVPSLDAAIARWREEVKEYYSNLADLESFPIVSVLKMVGAYHARANQIRNQLLQTDHNKAIRFRLDCIDPFIAALEFQFKVWSRVGSQIDSEWKMTTT